MSNRPPQSTAYLSDPVIVPVEAYISPEYARAEGERLWTRVWQVACRVEDLPEIGSFVTYEVANNSVLVIRTAEDEIRAFHNVCSHRGRRLVDVPPGERNASGRRSRFVCGYHGWTYNAQGQNVLIPKQEHWQAQLAPECASLRGVNSGLWGGWVWINLDPDCEPLMDYLDPIPAMLDPFQLQNMRVRWRKWGIFDCNWKVAMEAFNETYHVAQTHPEISRYGDFAGWSRIHGYHSNIGYEAPKDMDKNQQAKLRVSDGPDPRVSTAEMQNFIWEKANTNTTQTLVDAANRLKDELPEGTPADQVLKHWLMSARAADEARGVVWPTVDPEHVAKSGTAWQVFPNFQIGHAVNNMLCYSARPYGDDPDKCIFEGSVYELYPEGEGPRPEWEFCPPTAEAWCFVLSQDFSNMAAVQQGMKSAGYAGNRINPYMERATANLHHNLSRFMGSGAPVPYRHGE